MATGRSPADAVLRACDCFGAEQPLVTMIRTLAVGQRYRSTTVLAAMEAAAVEREPWRDACPDLSAREREHVFLLVQGLGDRKIAEHVGENDEIARSRGKALRRKPGASSRSALQPGDGELGADAGAGMLQGSPQQRNGPAVTEHAAHHDAAAVPEHRDDLRQNQELAWFLPGLQRPEHQWAVKPLQLDTGIAPPALSAPLPAGGKAVARRQNAPPAIEADGVAEQTTWLSSRPATMQARSIRWRWLALAVLTQIRSAQPGAGAWNPIGVWLVSRPHGSSKDR